MQLAEPPSGEAFSDDTCGTIGVQPRRCESGLRRKAIKVDSAHLKTREDLFDNAFEIVKFDSSAGVESALIREALQRRRMQCGALFHSFGGAAEDSTEFEDAHFADVAMKIAGNGGESARNQ